MMMKSDAYWMRRALRLAAKGRGVCSPNPMVGAVLVKNGVLLGEGWHQKAGQAHAEINALRSAGEGRAKGATIYVTLEPCCTAGRTPPCTSAIIAAGIARVVIGCMDDNPKHRGKAVEILEAHGIEVTACVLEEKCRKLNEHFFWWIQERRPYVCLKMAMTLDGRIATASGQSKWITGAAARNRVQQLRQLAGAIMVGGNTALLDNPGLKVVAPNHFPVQPRPVVWTDRQLPDSLKLCSDPERPLLTVKPKTQREWLDFLAELGAQDCNMLLLEGGGELAASALKAGIVNKIYFFIAPKILSGRGSRPVVGGENPESLQEALDISRMKCERVGDDFLFTGYCENVYRNH